MRDHEEALKSKKEEEPKQVETAGSVGKEGEVKGTKAVEEKVGEEEVGERGHQHGIGWSGECWSWRKSSRKARVPPLAIVRGPAGGDSNHPAYPS
jgi:hypothetical protein